MLGPYGIKYLGEKLMERCERHVHEMLSIVQENKEFLIQLRACTMDQFPTGMVCFNLVLGVFHFSCVHITSRD